MNLFADALTWLTDPANWGGASGIPARIGEHLWVSGLAVAIAAVIALPAGVLIGHTRRGVGAIGAFTGAARALPTLGVLTICALWFGIGLGAPLVALVVLAIPSLLAGAYSGVQAVPRETAEAARAIGMRQAQVIWQVEVPLALPVIVGGIRAAVLQVVATATLAAYTANLGLGRYLFAGLKTRDYGQMLGAAILVILLALALEIALAAIQRAVTTRLTPRAAAQPTTTATT
ncbi:ABC transporter permease [Leucobacter albus]|uniref:ABC transporter permease n=1 Tax=Leucobacter albus TaxID=272210 RepID=A0ABW3TRD4_9MICO